MNQLFNAHEFPSTVRGLEKWSIVSLMHAGPAGLLPTVGVPSQSAALLGKGSMAAFDWLIG